jgi:hypothetical protein
MNSSTAPRGRPQAASSLLQLHHHPPPKHTGRTWGGAGLGGTSSGEGDGTRTGERCVRRLEAQASGMDARRGEASWPRGGDPACGERRGRARRGLAG